MDDSVETKTGKGAAGTFYTIAAFVIWGLLPGYWKMLKSIPPLEIVFHRIIWTCLISFVLVLLTGKGAVFYNILKKRKLRATAFFSSLTIVSNWLIYVYAVNTGRIVEASLGYFINPLVSILLGMVVLRERLSTVQYLALAIASSAVIYLSAGLGSFPWIALTLAFSFGLYGLIKKIGNLDSVASLGVETLYILPAALVFILTREYGGTGAMGSASFSMIMILLGTGAVSAFPLFLFAEGAKSIPLSRVGFLQYISPSIMLLIGVAVYGEKFTATHAVSFSLIWCALVIYSVSGLMKMRTGRIYSE